MTTKIELISWFILITYVMIACGSPGWYNYGAMAAQITVSILFAALVTIAIHKKSTRTPK